MTIQNDIRIRIEGWDASVDLLAGLAADGSDEAIFQILRDWDDYFGVYRSEIAGYWPHLTAEQKARVLALDEKAYEVDRRIHELTGMSVRQAILSARELEDGVPDDGSD
jgi:hypothetical protein